ncbi:UNVERIFIED_CONTAM: putative inactive receptor kinase [Sesamum latifolium]|uniref:Inactive receptor kinase n=1 Tax=Sesamum latifolium TaxID=2727402 RepID=A0AAW2T7D8_9LAMI
MSAIYDNWERLVDAVLRRELLWQICHDHSRTPSLLSSVSSDFSLSSPLSCAFAYAPDETFMSDKCLPLQISGNIRASVRQEEAKEESDQLVLLGGSPVEFGLQELLMAPSVALGEKVETFRNTYLVRLREDFIFVVKRFSREYLSRDAFEKRVRVKLIAGIEHENIVKMMGYYMNEDECLQILEYFPQGSLETMLHGKNRVHLDWETRLRIAIGAAKGLAHIHRHRSGKFVHGNIKASNIFLNSEQYGCISDISIATVLITKYHDPEVTEKKRTSQPSDVYSFGVLLIELLTGRSPLRSNGRHLRFADWALHNARDGWTSLAFDKKLLKNPVVKQGMGDAGRSLILCGKETRRQTNHDTSSGYVGQECI